MWRGFSCGLVWAVGCKFLISVFLVLLGKQLVIEHIFEYNGGMELGEPPATLGSRLDEALDTFDAAPTDLISTVDSGGLDQLSAEEKLGVATLRNPPQPTSAG